MLYLFGISTKRAWGGVGAHIFFAIRAQVRRLQDFGLSMQKTQVETGGLGENRAWFQHIGTTTKNHRRYNDVF